MKRIDFSAHDLLEPLPNGTYRSGDLIPVVSDVNPLDFIKACVEVKNIDRGVHFSVTGFVEERNKRWYRTNKGFINENALLGKTLIKI